MNQMTPPEKLLIAYGVFVSVVLIGLVVAAKLDL